MTDDLTELQTLQEEFVAERDWGTEHRPKNIAIALSVETSELVELYRWREIESGATCREDDRLCEQTREEPADVLLYVLSMASQLDIDLGAATVEKLEQNRERYPPSDATTSE